VAVLQLRLCSKKEWARLPEIVRWFDISSSTINVGSACGGLLCVTLPPSLHLGPLAIQVSGE
jgi:hypothetical protein